MAVLSNSHLLLSTIPPLSPHRLPAYYFQGDKGLRGSQGFVGLAGPPGQKGKRGVTGSKGDIGEKVSGSFCVAGCLFTCRYPWQRWLNVVCGRANQVVLDNQVTRELLEIG